MRRPPPRDEPPQRRFRRDMPRPEGPFDRLLRTRRERDPAPIIIGGTVGFLALVILVVVLGSSLLGGGGGGSPRSNGSGDQDFTLAQGRISGRFAPLPALPPGLEAVSNYYQFTTDKNNQPVLSDIALPLREDVSGVAGLGFYTFFEDHWQRVAEVKSVSNKTATADISEVPANVAVLRVKKQVYHVAGSLPAGGTLHADAKVDILSPREYTPAGDGTVAGNGSDAPNQANIQFMPTVVGSGRDTSGIVNNILADESLRRKHIDALTELAKQHNIAGLDLEYSSVDPDRESAFTDFVGTLANKLHGENKRLSLTLPPPSDQRQAYDWKKLGQSADIIKILPIADPQAYWKTMPGAMARITGDVDPAKIMLVVSPFSVEGSGNTSRPIGYLQAMVQAAEAVVREPANADDIKPGTAVKLVAKNLDEGEGASPIRWNDDSATLSYSLGGTEPKRVYIENSFSVAFKLEIVQAYALGGVALSDAAAQSDVANVWPTINELVESATVPLVRPNDSNLLPIWQAPDGGDLGAGAGTTASWIPKKAGPHNLVLVVSDGERRFGRKTLVEVQKATEASPAPLVTFGPTPTATVISTVTPSPSPAVPLQVGNTVDGDADNQFHNDEQTAPGATVSYRIIIDNDSSVPVIITSINDDIYGAVTCKEDTDGDHVPDTDVLGKTLQPDDGDGPIIDANGKDAVVCYFDEQAPTHPNVTVTDTITVIVKDAAGTPGSDSDGASITTKP